MTVSNALVLTAWLASPLAQEEGPRNTGPDFGKASPFGLIIVILLLLGTFALVWSMNRQLKKVPASFDTGPAEARQAVEESTGAVSESTGAVEPDSAAPDERVRREPGG